MLPLHNEQFEQKYTNLCFKRYYEKPSKHWVSHGCCDIRNRVFVGGSDAAIEEDLYG
jgi:hypothetical protein